MYLPETKSILQGKVMGLVRFVISSAALSLLLLVPFFLFAFLKFNGLHDAFPQEDVSYGDEPSTCVSRFEFGTFVHQLDTVGTCFVARCNENGKCSLVAGSGSGLITLEYGNSESAIAETQSIFNAMQERSPTEYTERNNVGELDIKDVEYQALETYVHNLNDNSYGYALWQWAAIFSICISFCMMGTSTSTIMRISADSNVLRSTNLVAMFFSASVASLLLVSVFAGGLMQGNLFPNFSGDVENFGFNSWNALKFRGQDWFKLAIWAYISGFHERFLPDILSDLMKKHDTPAD